MAVMRATETFLWPDPFARTEHFGARYEEAFTQPPKFDVRSRPCEWDGDPLVVNARRSRPLRERALPSRAAVPPRLGAASLAFAAATSAVWEYGFEANGARPSALDLVYTPLAGLALGEARYLLHRAAGDVRLACRARASCGPSSIRSAKLERAVGTRC